MLNAGINGGRYLRRSFRRYKLVHVISDAGSEEISESRSIRSERLDKQDKPQNRIVHWLL